jgi:hypothetical protein
MHISINLKILLLLIIPLFLFGCYKKLHTDYTTAYKKRSYYFAGQNLSLYSDSTFYWNYWTDHLGYGQEGKGTYSVHNNRLFLHYSGYENEIKAYLMEPMEQNKIHIKSLNSTSCFPIQIQGLDNYGRSILGFEIRLFDTLGQMIDIKEFDLFDGVVIFEGGNNMEQKFIFTSTEKYTNGERLHFEFSSSNSLDTVIFLADHIPYIESGRKDTFEIRPFGMFLIGKQSKIDKFKKVKK